MYQSRLLEKSIATASFVAAVAFAFTSLYISDEHEVAAGNCTVIAQFLLLTASLFGIDYKLNQFGSTKPRSNEKTNSPNNHTADASVM